MLSERKERLPSKSLRLAQFVRKRGMFIVSQALPVNNPQQILSAVAVITPRGSVRGNTGGRGGWPQIPWESISARESFPESPVGLARHCYRNLNVLLNEYTHACTHTVFSLHASVLCKHRSDSPLWAVSVALIRLFVLQFPPCSYPCFVHCHSSRIM